MVSNFFTCICIHSFIGEIPKVTFNTCPQEHVQSHTCLKREVETVKILLKNQNRECVLHKSATFLKVKK